MLRVVIGLLVEWIGPKCAGTISQVIVIAGLFAAWTRGGMVAVYMARAAAATVANRLIAAGRDPTTPVLILVDASLSNERSIRGKLSVLSFLTEAINQENSILLLIGEAVQTSAAPLFAASIPDLGIMTLLR